MSSSITNNLTNSNGQIVPLGKDGDFANTRGPRLNRDAFGVIFSFLSGYELKDLEGRVCKNWDRCIESTYHWKNRCEVLFRISDENLSYKEYYRLRTFDIIGGKVFGAYVGDVGPVPDIPKKIALTIGNNPDPCDLTKKIYESYVWMYCPTYIETKVKGYILNKVDDPNDPDAPRLIPNGTESEGPLLKVPVTINNMKILFERPKKGPPSSYRYICNEIETQHGDKRRAAGWICMRKEVIARGSTFLLEQALANEQGVAIVSLQDRILFNFIQHVRSGVHSDNSQTTPPTFARTATLINNFPLACGYGNSSGLAVGRGNLPPGEMGAAVALRCRRKMHSRPTR